jgi:hypothetical protein
MRCTRSRPSSSRRSAQGPAISGAARRKSSSTLTHSLAYLERIEVEIVVVGDPGGVEIEEGGFLDDPPDENEILGRDPQTGLLGELTRRGFDARLTCEGAAAGSSTRAASPSSPHGAS